MSGMRLTNYVSSGDALSKINRNWRDWENNHADNAVSPSKSGTTNKNSTVTKRKSCTSRASAHGIKSKFSARAGKRAFKQNLSKNNLSNKKFNSVQNESQRKMNRDLMDRKNHNISWSQLTNGERVKIDDYYENGEVYSSSNTLSVAIKSNKVNLWEAESMGLAASYSKLNRMSSAFARMIYKFGEDNFGKDTEGDDFWCERMIAERVVSRKNINHCKKSLEKDRIIIMLDSSPSCENQASFYSQIASIAARFGDIELYDAPNGRIIKAYSPRDKDFYYIYNKDDVLNNAHRWSYLENRNIIIFTDGDSTEVVEENQKRNNIILLTTSNTSNYMYKNMRVNWFKNIDEPEDLIKVAKKLK